MADFPPLEPLHEHEVACDGGAEEGEARVGRARNSTPAALGALDQLGRLELDFLQTNKQAKKKQKKTKTKTKTKKNTERGLTSRETLVRHLFFFFLFLLLLLCCVDVDEETSVGPTIKEFRSCTQTRPRPETESIMPSSSIT